MSKDHKLPDWAFFLIWILTSLLGTALGYVVFFIGGVTIGETTGAMAQIATPLFLLLFAIVFGLVTGLAQWFVLKRYSEKTAVWIGATLLGYLIASPAVLAWGGGFGPVILPSESFMMAAAIGLALGLMQWLFLRRKVNLSEWWIAISLAGWILADMVAIWLKLQDYQMGPIYYWVGLIFFGIAITGAGLALLSRRRAQPDLPGG